VAERKLPTKLRAARTLLREWKRALHDGHKCREPGPNFGKVDDQMAAELVRFDEAREAISEAIKLALQRADSQ
jgi:hypothetical protein